jgi:dienelactone hydrolase
VTISPPGSWPSRLSAQSVATAGVAYGQVGLTDGGRTVCWTESRPSEGGRTTVLRRSRDEPAQEVLPPQLDARTRVHEYGGSCWMPYGDGLVTSDLSDQRLWLVGEGDPRPLTPETGAADRYGEPKPLPGGTHVMAIREQVGERVVHELVAVPLDGSGEVRVLWDGSDFVVSAAVSPDGSRLAFVTWDHPRMPWDGSQVRVAPLLPGPALGPAKVVLGGPEQAAQDPVWVDDRTLRAVTDATGWWNLVHVGADGGAPEPLWPVARDCGLPMWRFGWTTHLSLPAGRVATLHGLRLGVLQAGEARDLDVPFTRWMPFLAVDGDVVAGVAWTPTRAPAVVAVDTATGAWHEVDGPVQPDPDWTPVPQTVEVPSAGGRTTFAHVYPPTNPEVALPKGAAAPYVVFVHGGPTAHVPLHYDAGVAFFTSRGIGVANVDYGGSSGYGRAYRESLRGQWGIVDVEDCEAVARWLRQTGRASGVAIRGGSAGGWTVLCALTRGDSVFDAGTSLYGVADAVELAAHTHDFESGYLDGLLGPLPAAREVYDERSPLTHADRLDRPVLLLQGLDDPVVPPAQAERFLAALAGTSVPRAYLPFEGESHGFRRAETIVAAWEAELSFYGQVFGFDPPGVPRLPLAGAGED